MNVSYSICEERIHKNIDDSQIKKMNDLNGLDKKNGWIDSNLEVQPSNFISRFFWSYFAKYFDWSRKLFFNIDLEQSRKLLNQIYNTILISPKNTLLDNIYINAAKAFNNIAPNHQVPQELTRENQVLKPIEVQPLELSFDRSMKIAEQEPSKIPEQEPSKNKKYAHGQ